MKLGILGGTFNPVHLGHLSCASDVMARLALDKVLFVPARIPPIKGERHETSDEKRLEILAAALLDYPDFELCKIEFERADPSYTAITLDLLSARYSLKAQQLYFIVGIDAFSAIESWWNYKHLVTLSNFVVVDRPGYESAFNNLKLIADKLGFCYNENRPITDLTGTSISEKKGHRNKDSNTFHKSVEPSAVDCKSAVIQSDPINSDNKEAKPCMINHFSSSSGVSIIGLQITPKQISSTEIRNLLKQGSSISGLVPSKLERLVKEAYTKI